MMKDKIIVGASIVFIVFFVYFTVVDNILINQEQTQKIESLQSNKEKLSKTLDVLNERIKRAKTYEEDEVVIMGYDNLQELENYINNLAIKNDIKINLIARPESSEESTKIYVGYEFSGKLKNILKFIGSTKDISYTDTPFILNLTNPAKFSCKLATNIMGRESEINDNYGLIKKELAHDIKNIFISSSGLKTHIILTYYSTNKVDDYLLNKEFINNDKHYVFKIQNKKLQLIKIKGDKNEK